MSGPRIAIAAPGAEAAEIVRLAVLAEEHNIDGIVVGSCHDGLPNGDDSYVTTAAAAAAIRTTYLRIGVTIGLRGSAWPLRIAEDLGVLDVMSNGRLDLVLRRGPEPGWSEDLQAVLGAWTAWPLVGEQHGGSVGGRNPDAEGRPLRTMPVTPSPVQPAIPAWVLEPSDPLTARPMRAGGAVIFLPWTASEQIPGVDELREMRRLRDQAGATTVAVDLASTPPERRAGVLRTLATVVGPCLRCADHEVEILALDATDWLVHRAHLHSPPLGELS